MMQLKVQIPGQVFIDEPVLKIIAEAENGFFCLEPRHIDFVAALVPGLVSYLAEDESERYLATDEGVLVKCGKEVLISTFHAVLGKELETLRETITNYFNNQSEEERVARAAVARLEAGIVRRFIEMEKLT